LHASKHDFPNVSISFGAITPNSRPKYLTIPVPSEVTSAFQFLLKLRLAGATSITINGQPTNVEPSIPSADGGIVIELSPDLAKACAPILFSLEQSSNVSVVILEQLIKHRSPIVSAADGTMTAAIAEKAVNKIGRSAEQIQSSVTKKGGGPSNCTLRQILGLKGEGSIAFTVAEHEIAERPAETECLCSNEFD
jgi:hypothetical protein